MPSGPYMEPEPRFRYAEPVWFLREGVRVAGTVELTVHQLGKGYLYQVRVSPMAMYWAGEDELRHSAQQPGEGE